MDAAALEVLEQAGYKVFPSAKCIAVTQDKFAQKSALQSAGLAVPKFCAVKSPDEISAAGNDFGWPVVLKPAATATMAKVISPEIAGRSHGRLAGFGRRQQ